MASILTALLTLLPARAADWPVWSLPAPLPRPGHGDLVYPAWFEGRWQVSSDGITYEARFQPTGQGVVGDRAFNAEGVGRAATSAFVHSFVLILVLDLFLGIWLNNVQDYIRPEGGRRLL